VVNTPPFLSEKSAVQIPIFLPALSRCAKITLVPIREQLWI
jgi:hypothetical protein